MKQTIKIFEGQEQPELKEILSNITIALGQRNSGKSNTLARTTEQLLKNNVNVAIIDIENEYADLLEGYKHLDLHAGNAEEIAEESINDNLPVMLSMPSEEDLTIFLQKIWELEQTEKTPYVLIVDEFWTLAPQGGKQTALQQVFKQISLRGRKYGIGIVGATQRSQNISKDLISQASQFFLHRVTHPRDLEVYEGIIGDSKIVANCKSLKQGECYAVNGSTKKRKVLKAETELGNATPSVEMLRPFGTASDRAETPLRQSKPQQRQQSGSILGLVGGALLSLLNSKPSRVMKTGQAAKSGFNWSYDSQTNKFKWSYL